MEPNCLRLSGLGWSHREEFGHCVEVQCSNESWASSLSASEHFWWPRGGQIRRHQRLEPWRASVRAQEQVFDVSAWPHTSKVEGPVTSLFGRREVIKQAQLRAQRQRHASANVAVDGSATAAHLWPTTVDLQEVVIHCWLQAKSATKRKSSCTAGRSYPSKGFAPPAAASRPCPPAHAALVPARAGGITVTAYRRGAKRSALTSAVP